MMWWNERARRKLPVFSRSWRPFLGTIYAGYCDRLVCRRSAMHTAAKQRPRKRSDPYLKNGCTVLLAFEFLLMVRLQLSNSYIAVRVVMSIPEDLCFARCFASSCCNHPCDVNVFHLVACMPRFIVLAETETGVYCSVHGTACAYVPPTAMSPGHSRRTRSW